MAAAAGDGLAAEQLADDLDCLFEHLVADVGRWPRSADHVLVEVLAGAHTEGESAFREQLHRCRLLRDDRRVVAHGRAGHVRHEVDRVRRLRDGT